MRHAMRAAAMIGLVLLTAAAPEARDDDAKAQVIRAIDAGYLNAYWNDMNMKALLAGWDPGAISMGIAPNDQMFHSSLLNWFSGMVNRKAPAKKEFTFVYPVIDVAGDMAMAKVEVMKGDVIQFTDYLPLFKTKTGWKIVAYPYYQHRNGERPPVAEGDAGAVRKTVEDTILHGLIENGNKEQVLAGLGEICDINRYVPEFDAVTKQDLGMLYLLRARGAKAFPVKSHDVSVIGITGNLAAARLTVNLESDSAINMHLALYKTKAGWKIVELTSDKPLESMINRPQRPQ